MSAYVGVTPLNSTDLQYQGLLERVLLATLVTFPSTIFLLVNAAMFYTLRSKVVFRETPRYVLLFNLLLADTLQLVHSQTMYLLASAHVRFSYPVCGFLIMLLEMTNEVSPLTLVVMSLERYVAVCFPLHHANVATLWNTTLAIALIYAFNSLNILTRVLLLLEFPFHTLPSLEMPDFCSDVAMSIGPRSNTYDAAYTGVLFLTAAVAIVASFVGVVLAARSASTDKASAKKAYNTVLLHLFQLGLSLSATIYSPLLMEVAKNVPRITFVRIHNVFYVCIVIFPRCLSSLIYGLRDQTIRPVLVQNLCCRASVLPQKSDPK